MDNLKDRVAFLSQSPEKLRALRGKELYDKLESLGLTHEHYFRAIGSNVHAYATQEFGIDILTMTLKDIRHQAPDMQYIMPSIVVNAIKSGFKQTAKFPAITIDDSGVACGTEIRLFCEPGIAETIGYKEYRKRMERLGQRLALIAGARAIERLGEGAETTKDVYDAWNTLYYSNGFTPTHRILKGKGLEPGKFLGAQYVNMDVDGELLIDAGYALRHVGSGITISKGMLMNGGVGNVMATLDIDFHVLYRKAAIKIVAGKDQ